MCLKIKHSTNNDWEQFHHLFKSPSNLICRHDNLIKSQANLNVFMWHQCTVITSIKIYSYYTYYAFYIPFIVISYSSGPRLRFLFHGRVIAKSYLFPISASALNQPFEVIFSLFFPLSLYLFVCSCYLSRWCLVRTSLEAAGRDILLF